MYFIGFKVKAVARETVATYDCRHKTQATITMEIDMPARTTIASKKTVEAQLKAQGMLQGPEYKEVRSEFLKSIKIKNGGIAHFYYAAVKGVLSKKDFDTLLKVMGIKVSTFVILKDHTCGSPGFPNLCFVKAGYYCDGDFCH